MSDVPKLKLHPCPHCKAMTHWEGNSWRPFCSERCKMVDLGLWSMEQYRIAGKPTEEQGESSSTPGSANREDDDDVD